MDRVLKWALRAPALIFDTGADRVLGHRFLLLTHHGRHTGRPYRTVLEVLSWRPEIDEAIVMSGFGPRAQWLQNVLAGRPAEIRIAGRDWPVIARHVEPAEAVRTLAAYECRNRWLRPVVRRILSRLSGVTYDGTVAARLAVVQALPLVAFRPAAPLGVTPPPPPARPAADG
jgi:deazaflavin-dependent oxidoreductase (nitroreductase family)